MTAYSFMIFDDDEGKISRIDRKAGNVTIPPLTNAIGQFACFIGSITSLHIENTQI